ncbi:MAG TPA: succinate dehydrogenase assembly factor 2 [Gammaproteobacteria bacterium]|nr:succinate dehydrogenase assembly factor 2 [Xanthomonadales bacterium]MCB1594558.1 succinate dehydrogenase assembly factor 2 [Xanthomonadales bacterium]HOP21701.1 succinate dehydrogenase assembly factor 2 [Gammaproteobacteria bacterium]HPI95592.1 succinate dehydrogenase assembly factor 2 [Gammaproteobacteria bacterium]HPQ86825.1 succinate dehydrogenase assembly factor 2 [Gammaproteobacteria bacterium]
MSERLKKGYLQWRCRRGTKELDVILIRFMDNHYEQMSDDELLDFDRLLDNQDTLLWDWFCGHLVPENKNDKHLVHKINPKLADKV